MTRGSTTGNRQRTGVILLTALAVVAAACGGSDNATGTPDNVDQASPAVEAGDPIYGGKVVFGLAAESNGWDPTLGQWAPWGLTVARTIFDTLTTFDEEGNVQPHLAESFTPNDDFTEWVVKLRPDVRFHNGEVLDAAALQANWEFFAASPLTGPIFEVRPFSYEILSDLELKVTLPEPWAAFPGAFATQIGVVMAPETLGQDGPTRARQPIGTGPFKLDEWILDDHLTVIRNEDYWQEGLPYLDEIEFRPIIDPTSRSSALKAGDIDMAFFDEPNHWEVFSGDADFTVWQDPQAETPESFVMLNMLDPQLSDPRLREALALATDSTTFVEATTPGRDVATGPFKENSPWYAATDWPAFDLEAASELIDEVEADTGPVKIVLSVGPAVNQNQQAQLIAQMWAEAGVEVEIKATETAQLIIEVATGNFESVMWRQFDSPSPLLEAVWWQEAFANDIGEIALNFAHNRNPDLTAAIIAAQETDDVAEQKGYFTTVQEELASDMPYIWISHIDPAIVAGTSVAGMFNYRVPDSDAKVMSFMNSSNALTQIWVKPE
jgi:peptide/nickel transport system substrate-binding protein